MSVISAQMEVLQGHLRWHALAAVAAAQRTHAALTTRQRRAIAAAAAAAVAVSIYRLSSSVLHRRGVARREAALARLGGDGAVHLFAMPRSPYAPSLSGACTKVETFLRAMRIPYVRHETMDTTGSPNDCLPFIVYRGRRLADSERIVEFLATEFRVWNDLRLSREDRAVGVALKRSLDYTVNPFFYRLVFVEHPVLAVEALRFCGGGAPFAARVPALVARCVIGSLGRAIAAEQSLTVLSTLTMRQAEARFARHMAAIETTLEDNGSGNGLLFGCGPPLTSSDEETEEVGGGNGDDDGGVELAQWRFSRQATSFDCAVFAMLLPIANMARRCRATDPSLYELRRVTFDAVAESAPIMAFLQRMTHLSFPDLVAPLEAFGGGPTTTTTTTAAAAVGAVGAGKRVSFSMTRVGRGGAPLGKREEEEGEEGEEGGVAVAGVVAVNDDDGDDEAMGAAAAPVHVAAAA